MTTLTTAQLKQSFFRSKSVQVGTRYLVIFVVAFFLFGVILLLAGKDPVAAIQDILVYTLGTPSGFSEVIVRMIPLLFTAIAVALPSRVV
jgi:simple sugar transport system permease protein